MVGPHESDLRKSVAPGNVLTVWIGEMAWTKQSSNLRDASEILKKSAPDIRTGFGGESQTGATAEQAFIAIADKLNEHAEKMDTVSSALGVARVGLAAAVVADNDLQANPLTPPTAPTYDPNVSDMDAIKKEMIYSRQLSTYNTAAAEREQQATQALKTMDEAYAEAAASMKTVHGQPDVPITPGGGDDGGGTPTGPGYPNNNNGNNNNNNTTTTTGVVDPGPTTPTTPTTNQPPTTVTPPTTNPTQPTTIHPVVHPPTEVSPPVIGTPQGPGTATPVVSHPTINGTLPSGGSSGTSGTAAAGVLGAGALGALGARGGGGALGATGSVRGGLSSSGTRAIGSTGRASQGSVLGRGTGTGGSGAGAGRGSAAGAGRSGGAGSSRSASGRGAAGRAGAAGSGTRGAAGGRGAGKSTVGKGVAGKGGAGAGAGKGAAGRTGPAGKGNGRAGVVAGAGRGGKDKKDPRQSDVFESEQDWVEDEGIAPGVLD